MNKVLRATAVVVAAGLAVPLWAAPSAYAATSATEAASDGAYFYREGISKPDPLPFAPPNVTGAADGVKEGHLAVAAAAGGEDKVSFLRFSLLDAPFDAVVTKAILTVKLVPNGDGNVVVSPDPAKVRACMAGDSGFSGDDAANITLAPERLCEQFSAPATATADGSAYEFDITGLAAQWLAVGNDGVALTVAEGAASSPFQIVFAPFPEATLAYEYTAAPTTTFPDFSAPTTGDAGTTFDSGFSGGSLPSVDSGSFGSVEAPAVDTALPEPAPEAAPAPEPAVAEPVQNVAIADPSITPGTAFWIGALLIGAMLALLSLILGDSRVAAPGASRPSRLSQALQARQPGSANRPSFSRPSLA